MIPLDVSTFFSIHEMSANTRLLFALSSAMSPLHHRIVNDSSPKVDNVVKFDDLLVHQVIVAHIDDTPRLSPILFKISHDYGFLTNGDLIFVICDEVGEGLKSKSAHFQK